LIDFSNAQKNILWNDNDSSYPRAKCYDNLAEIRRRIGKRFNYRTKGYYRTVRLIIYG